MTKKITKIIIGLLATVFVLPVLSLAYQQYPTLPPHNTSAQSAKWDPNLERWTLSDKNQTPVNKPVQTDQTQIPTVIPPLPSPYNVERSDIIRKIVLKVADGLYLTCGVTEIGIYYDITDEKGKISEKINRLNNNKANAETTEIYLKYEQINTYESDIISPEQSCQIDADFLKELYDLYNKYKDTNGSFSSNNQTTTKTYYGTTANQSSTPNSEVDKLAQALGLKPISAIATGGENGIYYYATDAIPALQSGQVLIKGDQLITETAKDGIYGITTYKYQDNFYILDKNNLPNGYVLQGSNMISPGGTNMYTSEGFFISASANNKYIPVYNLMTEANALARENKANDNGVFTYNIANAGIPMTVLVKVYYGARLAISGNNSILSHSAMKSYSDPKNPPSRLAKFGNYGAVVAARNLSQADTEKAIYDYVNNVIQFKLPSMSKQSVLINAIDTKSGVCRDKAPALEYGLAMAGIKTARVVSDQHVFVAVLKSDGKTVDHYLDPMYYETYLPLTRPSVKPNQIIYNQFNN